MRKDADPLLLELQRFNAARMSDLGLEPKIIAASLDVDDQTVRRWLRDYQAGGFDALKARLHPGPKPRMSEQQKQEFVELIQLPPQAYAAEGLSGKLWTTSKMARLIKCRFGVSYHPNHIGQMMHELDYSQQLPQKAPRERDEEKIKQWREVEWPRIVQRARETSASIVLVDEAGFLMDPLRKKVWAPRGQTPELVHRMKHHEKVSVIGGLKVTTTSSQIELLTQWHPGQSIGSEEVVLFLEAVLEHCGGNVIVVWDNLPAHRSIMVKDFCRENHRMWLEALPGYAPELNPIELVWCMSKYHRMANHGIMELEQLQAAAWQATGEVGDDQSLLRSCFDHTGLADALYPSGDQ